MLLLIKSYFRTQENLEKERTVRSITADGVAKEAKYFAARHVLLCFATNAFDQISAVRMLRRSKTTMTGRASSATATFSSINERIIGH